MPTGQVATVSRLDGSLTAWMRGAIVAICIAAFCTQWFAFATGRDFLFGLIPKLNPAGSRTIPAWFASSALALAAVFAVCNAHAHKAIRVAASTPWTGLAIILIVLSADRFASIGALLDRPALRLNAAWAQSLLTWAIYTGALLVYSLCVSQLPKPMRGRFVEAAVLFTVGATACYFAPPPQRTDSLQQRGLHIMMIVVGRGLELFGITRFLNSAIGSLPDGILAVSTSVRPAGHRALEARRRGRTLTLSVSASRVRAILIFVAAVLLTAGFGAAVAREIKGWPIEDFYRLLFVDFEGNLPTWFSFLLLLTCAACLAFIAFTQPMERDPAWRMWALLSVLFVALSADEAAAVHELTVIPLRALLNHNEWLRYPLIVPGAIGVAVLAALFWRFAPGLPPATRRGICLGGAMFVCGALILDTVGGWFDPTLHGPSIVYTLLSTLEEGLEMCGAIVILHTLLSHIQTHVGAVTISGPQGPGLRQLS